MAQESSNHQSIIPCYAPTNDSKEEVKEELYDRLQTIMQIYTEKDVTILMGEFNAKLGDDNSRYEDVMGTQGLIEINENGEKFVYIYTFNNLVIRGSVFPTRTNFANHQSKEAQSHQKRKHKKNTPR